MHRISFSALLCAVLCVALHNSQLVNAADLLFTIGYLRMGTSDCDRPSTLAGFLATTQYANTYNLVRGVKFALNVTTIPCLNFTDCSNLTPDNAALLQGFKDAMPGYTVILKPNYIIANTIVDEAKRLGGIPVLDADDIRMTSFQSTTSANVINFNHNWQRQAAHLFTYMFQTSRCVYSGVVHGAYVGDIPYHVSGIQQLYTAGGYPSPPRIDAMGANISTLNAFFSDANRRCYIIIGTPLVFDTLMSRLVGLNYDFTQSVFYAVSTAAGEDFAINGSSSMYAKTKFIDWTPYFESATLNKAFQEWLPTTASYVDLFVTGEILPTAVTRYTLQSYLTMRLIFDTIRDAVARESNPNSTSALPIVWPKILDSFYRAERVIEGYTFSAPVRTCPQIPAKQLCFCNTITSYSYLFGINVTTGTGYPLYDDVSLGQRNIASLEIIDTCGYNASSWSYPITGLALYPTDLDATVGMRLSDVHDIYTIFSAVYGTMTAQINYAATAPTRALRYATYDVPSTTPFQISLDKYIQTLRPFVIYGSLAGRIENPRGILTLRPSFTGLDTEDPPLVPASQWRWDIISLQPVLADYIHALAAYHQATARVYTSLHAIATTRREAELISLSLATWGHDLPNASVVVSTDPTIWAASVSTWMRSGSNPFVFAATTTDNNSLIEVAAGIAAPLGKGILAVACSIVYAHSVQEAVTFNSNGKGDIIFGAVLSPWWVPSASYDVPASLQQYVSNPHYQLAMLGLNVARQLYIQAYYDYSITAAQVLYKSGVVSAAGTAFGPFSNTSCTGDEIGNNTRDRDCQCTKGVRTIYIHSIRNYQAGVPSSNTGSYSYTMTTCGVTYGPYIPTFDSRSNNNGLSSGAIAGISVGCSIALLIVIAGFVINALFFGRNNRSAPKDSSLPFAIVFTDIQSSTSLWARAPSAMSEAVDTHHHLIRKAVKKNSGYEVKTVGDCFMVAFKSAADAATFALDVQSMLYEAEWSDELDAIYLELLAEEEAEALAISNPDVADSNSLSKIMQDQCESDPKQQHSRGNRAESIQSNARRLSNVDGGVPNIVVTHNRSRNSLVAFTNQPNQPVISVLVVPEGRGGQGVNDWSSDASAIMSGRQTVWHGLRVRIGVHFGMGDIRKDPVSLGYDYYGTVVNTGARIEGVGHGGQTLISDSVFDLLPSGFAKSTNSVIISLGPQPLRGLDQPIKLFQITPANLQGRRFPALRLHIENDTEVSSMTETATATGTNNTESADDIAGRICGSKNFTGIHPDELLDRYQNFLANFGPTTDKYKASVITKLAESWGFEKASKAVSSGDFGRTRLLISMLAKVTKSYLAGQKRAGRRQRVNTRTLSHEECVSEAVKSIRNADAEMGSFSDGKYSN